jgi:hypothetical protein
VPSPFELSGGAECVDRSRFRAVRINLRMALNDTLEAGCNSQHTGLTNKSWWMLGGVERESCEAGVLLSPRLPNSASPIRAPRRYRDKLKA